MKERLQSALKDLLDQAKKADVLAAELKKKIANFDRDAARAELDKIKTRSLKEVQKLRKKVEKQIVEVTVEINKTSDRFKAEKDRVKAGFEEAMKNLSQQVKEMTEAERKKRRGRSRSGRT